MKLPNIWLMICVVIVFICAQTISDNVKSERVNLATYKQARTVLIEMLNIETGVRGYLVTGKPEYLEPYNASKKVIYPAIDTLGEITSRSPEDAAAFMEIKNACNNKLKYMEKIVALKDSGDQAAVTIEQGSGTGKGYMDEIRRSIVVLADKHDKLFMEKQLSTLGTLHNLKLSLLALVVISLLESVYKFYRFKRRQTIMNPSFIKRSRK